MIEQKKNVNFGTITAITLATYTTFKMYRAISNLLNLKKENNLVTRQNFTISIMAAFVSILTLQNTKINVFDESENKSDMIVLCIISILSILLFTFSIYSFISGIKKTNK